MLDTLMKVGAHRIDYFDNVRASNPLAFGFYIRGEKDTRDVISHDAKSQLYAGLMLIHTKLQMNNLSGIYVDVDALANLERPAYKQLKVDLVSGLFKRLFVLDISALLGTPEANHDLRDVYIQSEGFELMYCRNGECVAVDIFSDPIH